MALSSFLSLPRLFLGQNCSPPAAVHGPYGRFIVWSKRWKCELGPDTILSGLGVIYMQHIYTMRIHFGGHAFILDTKYTLANITSEDGASLGYFWDLVIISSTKSRPPRVAAHVLSRMNPDKQQNDKAPPSNVGQQL